MGPPLKVIGSFKVTESGKRRGEGRGDMSQLPEKKEKISKPFGSRVVESMAISCLCGCLSELECEYRRACWTEAGGVTHGEIFMTLSETPREEGEQQQV